MIDALEDSLRQIAANSTETRVSTTTLLPSGAVATVAVRPSPNGTYFVSDQGAGFEDLRALGHLDLNGGDKKRASAVASRLGLTFDGSGFSLREVTADQLAGAIIFVAEAVREWTQATAEHAIRRSEVSIARRVEERIRAALPSAQVDRERELPGASTKKHRFDLVLSLPGERKAVFEVVTPNPNSLSSAHLKLFDLMAAHPEWPREVVTERLDEWDSADMTLLAGVATHVRGMDREWSDLSSTIQ